MKGTDHDPGNVRKMNNHWVCFSTRQQLPELVINLHGTHRNALDMIKLLTNRSIKRITSELPRKFAGLYDTADCKTGTISQSLRKFDSKLTRSLRIS